MATEDQRFNTTTVLDRRRTSGTKKRSTAAKNVHPEEEERLYYAIELNDSVLLRMVLADVDVDCKFPGHLGKSPLHICCEKGHTTCAKALLEAGANTDAQDDYWFLTPLMSSVSTGRPDMVRLLVDAGCNTETKDQYGKTAIHYAVNDVETGCLKELIEASADVNAADSNGRVPVWIAAEKDGHAECMRILIEANCDVNVKDKREKRTPLQVAIMKAHKDVIDYVKILLDAGADINVVDLLGMSPMTCVIHRLSATTFRDSTADERFLEITRLLVVRADYDVNFTSSARYHFQFHGTSLKMAVDRGLVKMVELLLSNGADPDAVDDKNVTPLHLAACHNFLTIAKLLIRANCSLDTCAEVTLFDVRHTSVTPFACALVSGYADFAELILDSGYDIRRESTAIIDLITSGQTVLVNPDLLERLSYFHNNPLPLLSLCRSFLRKHLGRDLERKVVQLPVPVGVKNYIRLSHILNTI